MKRIIALAWAVALILYAGSGLAAEWREGLSPAQPYTNVPEVDLTQELGYMMFYPNRDMPANIFGQTLYVYLPREDVMSGEGVLQLNTVEDGPVLRIAMNDAALVRHRAMSEAELDAWLWGSGSCFEISLPRSLDFGKTYYVTMAQDCIVTANDVRNPVITNPHTWRFTLGDEYGVGGLEYRRPLADGQYEGAVMTAQAGDELSFRLELGGEATSAVLFSRDLSVDFPVAYFEASGDVTGLVTGDAPAWGVMFFDAEGSLLDQLAF